MPLGRRIQSISISIPAHRAKQLEASSMKGTARPVAVAKAERRSRPARQAFDESGLGSTWPGGKELRNTRKARKRGGRRFVNQPLFAPFACFVVSTPEAPSRVSSSLFGLLPLPRASAGSDALAPPGEYDQSLGVDRVERVLFELAVSAGDL